MRVKQLVISVSNTEVWYDPRKYYRIVHMRRCLNVDEVRVVRQDKIVWRPILQPTHAMKWHVGYLVEKNIKTLLKPWKNR